MNPARPVQRQLDAYDAHDLASFVAECQGDMRVYRPPAVEPVLAGKATCSKHDADQRFNRPGLHAELLNRRVAGRI